MCGANLSATLFSKSNGTYHRVRLLLSGLPVAGYFIGESLDRELVRITILPD